MLVLQNMEVQNCIQKPSVEKKSSLLFENHGNTNSNPAAYFARHQIRVYTTLIVVKTKNYKSAVFEDKKTECTIWYPKRKLGEEIFNTCHIEDTLHTLDIPMSPCRVIYKSDFYEWAIA